MIPLLTPLVASPIPSAVAVAPGHGSVYVQPGFGLTGLDASAGVQVGLPARLAFSAGGVVAGAVGGLDAALRWNVVETDAIRFGPWLGYTLYALGSDGARANGPAAGLAVEGGGKVVRFDLSVTAIAWNPGSLDSDAVEPFTVPLYLSTTGVTARFSELHSVRLGLDPGLTPRLGYQATFRHWCVGGGLAFVYLTGPGIFVNGGYRW